MVKKIHYIWLGGKKKNHTIKKCIKSWKKHMPDWEIVEWNETNLDIDINKYCRQAYDSKKYAFASDVFRFDILYKEGGLYFDTDVKMLKSFEPILLRNDAFTGFETNHLVNPGLVIYSKFPGNKMFKRMIDLYDNITFIDDDGNYNLKVVGDYFGNILKDYGFILNGQYQKTHDFTIFPPTYFCPTNSTKSINLFSDNTYSVHLYAGSWCDKKKKRADLVRKIAYSVFKPKGMQVLKKFLHGAKRNGNYFK